jgi:hypothetical protein
MRILICLFSMSLVMSVLGQANAQHPMGSIQYTKIKTDGEDILISKRVPVKGEFIERKYTVMIPVKTEKGTIMRPETRAHRIQKMKTVFKPIGKENTFFSADGKKLEKKAVIAKIQMDGRMVIMLPLEQKLDENLKELIRKDAIIMKYEFKGTTAAVGIE